MPIVLADARNLIKRKLGHPTVKVELTDDQLTDALNDAAREYSQLLPKIFHVTVDAAVGVQRYYVAAGTYGRGVIDVLPEDKQLSFGKELDIFNPFDVAIATGMGESNHVDFAMLLQRRETTLAVLGAEFTWDFTPGDDPSTQQGVLLVTPPPSSSRKYTLVCVKSMTLAEVPVAGEQWCYDFALACAKETLGYVRRKFGSVQGVQTSLQTDGAELVTEGREAQAALIERLRTSRKSPALVPITGI